MADSIVFRYPEMRAAANEVRNIGTSFKTAANTFQSDFAGAISAWEGESKDKMMNFISNPVNEYLGTTIPELLEALAQLLDFNADQMEKADQQIAEAIPTSLQG